MAIPMNRLGGNAFSHSPNNDAEAEYDRLRDLAREEAKKRGDCFDRSRRAYDDGDGAAAKQLSNEGKQHGSKMEQYNKQASEFIFRENNAPGRHPDDTIDLHGQFVEEAEDILEERIRYATQQGQSHLHVIVGKGNHSTNHVQKIKPRVEQVCRELGLKYHTEENAGRMYINLTGGEAVPPPHQGGGGGGSHSGQQQQPHHGGGGQQQHHGGQQQQHGGQQQQHGGSGQQQGQDPVEKLIGKLVRKLGDCCTVM